MSTTQMLKSDAAVFFNNTACRDSNDTIYSGTKEGTGSLSVVSSSFVSSSLANLNMSLLLLSFTFNAKFALNNSTCVGGTLNYDMTWVNFTSTHLSSGYNPNTGAPALYATNLIHPTRIQCAPCPVLQYQLPTCKNNTCLHSPSTGVDCHGGPRAG